MINTKSSNLEHALLDLVESTGSKDVTAIAVSLLGLQVALAGNPSVAEREESATSALAALQQHIYDEAAREYRGPLASYLDEKTSAMMGLYDRLSAEGYVPAACKAVPKVREWFHRKLATATEEDVREFADVTLDALACFAPEARKLCAGALLFAVQENVVREYLEVASFITDDMDEPPAGQAARSLYTALLAANDWLCFTPDFLFYDNGSFSLAGAKSVRAAKDGSTLALCMEKIAAGMQRVPSGLAETIVCDLKTEIALRLTGFISENCTEKLSPAGLTCLERIPALLSDESVPEGDEFSAGELTAAFSMLYGAATADKGGTLLSLSELSGLAERSCIFHDALAERAASLLLFRVLEELYTLNVELPPVDAVLARLYLALDLRGSAALTDDSVLSWVCEEA